MARRLRLAAYCVALLGCSDSASPDNRAGAVAFSYTNGSTGGTIAVSGVLPLVEGAADTATWAVAVRDPTNQGLVILAHRPAGTATADVIVIGTDRSTAGRSDIPATCAAAICSSMTVIFSSGLICGLTAGTVTIGDISAKRTKGAFAGTGLCFTFAGDTTAFAVSNGTFDVAIAAGSLLGAGLRASGDQMALNSSNGWSHARHTWIALHAVEPNSLRPSVSAEPQ